MGGVLNLAGLRAPVEIRRDRMGIPHVYAETLVDLFFGQGFAAAQDRLWQMEHDRLRARGRLAAVVGPRGVAWDCFARRCAIGAAARAGFDSLDGTTREVLTAFSGGVSAFVESARERPVEVQALGYEPEPWEPWDPIGVFLARHVLFATWDTKLFNARVVSVLGEAGLRAFAAEGPVGSSVPLIVPPGVRAAVGEIPGADLDVAFAALSEIPELAAPGGSNAWAVHGSRTSTGFPLVAGDPHRLLEVPNVYAQVHLVGPGIDAVGLAFPGVPGVPHFGQTPEVAWAVTNAMADYQDVFVERFERDAGGLAYEYRGEWHAAERSVERIDVRGAEPVDVEVVHTHHGPVVVGDPKSGVALTLRSTGLRMAGAGLAATVPMLVARSVDDLDAALVHWVEPANNFVLADRAGDIQYRTAGKIPVRHLANHWLPVPGWTGEHEWQGLVPDAELPRCRNPEPGVIVTANQRITDGSYPHVLGHGYANGHRAARILARLDELAGGGVTVDDCAAIHRDDVLVAGLELAERLTKLDGAGLSERARRVRDLLAEWDGRMRRDVTAPALFAALREAVLRRLAGGSAASRVEGLRLPDEPPGTWPLLIHLNRSLPGLVATADTTLLDEGETWDGLLAEALEAAASHVGDGAGGTASGTGATWGDVHRARPQHALAGWSSELDEITAVPAPALAGDMDCVFAVGGAAGLSDDAYAGSTARYVFDLGDRERGGWVVPLGASGHPGSPHYADQQEAWAQGRLIPIVVDRAAVDSQAASAGTAMRLEPAG